MGIAMQESGGEMVLEKYIVTVEVGDWVVGKEEMKYSVYASSQTEAERHAYAEFGKENVKSVKRA